MIDHNRETEGELSPVPSLVPGTWTERIETIWQQVVLYKAFGDPDLAGAKSRRANAEKARAEAEQEASEDAATLCEVLEADGEADLRDAESAKTQADEQLGRAQEKLQEATKSSRRADKKQERLISEAKDKARNTIETARTATEREVAELKTRTVQEIDQVLAKIDAVRAAADEELETRKAIAKATGIRARSTELRRRLSLEDLGEAPTEQTPTEKPASDSTKGADPERELQSSSGRKRPEK